MKEKFLPAMGALCLCIGAQTAAAADYPPSMASGTLPLMYVNTENSAPIVDKVNQISAGMYITVPEGYEGFSDLGSESAPIAHTIRGRGNASWQLPQKPYKIKFSSKTAVLGMPKHKHYALIPYAAGYAEWISAYAGMEIGRMVGMPWNPRMQPVELVLNGSYEGLYFMVESMKIDSNRLDIYEQDDLCSDPELIKGGWLIEIDNYDDECQITIPETENMNLRVTYHTPEELTNMQEQYLINEFTAMNKAIYSGDKTGESWAQYIDPISVAQYFIVRELIHDTDGYNGSMYMHKDLGDNEKWHFGPMWDISSIIEKPDWIMNNHPSYSQVHWIEPIFNTDAFQEALSEVWTDFSPKLETLVEYVEELALRCKDADEANHQRWPESSKSDAISKFGYFRRLVRENHAWMDQRIAKTGAVSNVTVSDAEAAPRYYNLQGLPVSEDNMSKGVYIRIDGSGATKVLK